MQYVLLKKLVENIDSSKGKTVTLDRGLFLQILKAALSASNEFDEADYLKFNPDVKIAVQTGMLDSGLVHYVMTGYFENKLPKKIFIDEEFYLKNNPDIKKSSESGVIADLQTHFESNGYAEGRIPYSDFCLWPKF